jgi:sporulation protein YlmC with PRC-barrel domain
MDLATKILDEYKIITPGNKVLMEVSLFNLGTEAIKDVKLRYCISTSEDGIIRKCSEETIALYTKFQLVKEFLISTNTNPGVYLIRTEASYGNETISSEANFEVKKQAYLTKNTLLVPVILGIFIFILLIFITFLIYKKRRKTREIRYVREYKPQVIRRYEKSDRYPKIAGGLRNKLNLWKRQGYAGTDRLKEELKHLKNNKTFVSLIFAGILLITLMLNRKMTGMAIANSLGAVKGGIFLLPLVFVSILIIIFAIIKRKKIKELITNLSTPFGKNKQSNRLLGVIGMKVYCSEGNYLGKVKGVFLEGNRVGSWAIKIDKKSAKKIKNKNILLKHEYVQSISQIMIVDKKVSELLEKFKD